MSQRGLGAWGEDAAVAFLTNQGYRIIDRNWHAAHGELDIVAHDGETLVFVEVKARRGHDFGWPEDAVTPAKQARLRKTAWAYLLAHDREDDDFRFDVVAIDRGPAGTVGRLEHYVNAIGAEPLSES